MRNRILFGSIMIVVMVGLFWLDWWTGENSIVATRIAREGGDLQARPVVGLPLTVLMLLLVAVGVLEMARFAAAAGFALLRLTAMAGSMLLATMPFWWQLLPGPVRVEPTAADLLLLLGLLVMLAFAEQMVRSRVEGAIRQLAVTCLTVLYLGVGGALVLQIRITWGLEVLILFLAAVKFTDIGAFFTGSAIGRHKMIPWLSPGKSWEGLAGGVVVAALITLLAAWVLRIDDLLGWRGVVFGSLVGLTGQFADLCESLLKRDAKLKDSGALVPNFGGVLDIVDSPLLAAPVAMVLLNVLIG